MSGAARAPAVSLGSAVLPPVNCARGQSPVASLSSVERSRRKLPLWQGKSKRPSARKDKADVERKFATKAADA